MTLRLVAELFAGFLALVGLFFTSLVAVAFACFGSEDGTPLRSALDDRDRSRHLLDAALAEDKEVAALDALFALPAATGRGQR